MEGNPMKTLSVLASSAAVFVMASATHAAPTAATPDTNASMADEHGHALFVGTQSQFLGAITDSLKRDANGDAELDPSQCATKQTGCVTPKQLLYSLYSLYRVQLNVRYENSELVKLVPFYQRMDAHNERIKLESVREVGTPGNWKIDVSVTDYVRWSHPEKGEVVYYTSYDFNGVPLTTSPYAVAFSDCWNTVKIPREDLAVTTTLQPCKTIHIYHNPGDRIDTAQLLPADETVKDPKHCFAYKLPGQTEWTPGLPGQCDKSLCHYEDAEQKYHMVAMAPYARAEKLAGGDLVIRIPNVTEVVCRTGEDGKRYFNKIMFNDHFIGGVAWIIRSDDDPHGPTAVTWHIIAQ